MEGVRRAIVLRGEMALRAERIAGCAEREAVRLVAVPARPTRAVHLALHERAVLVHLALDLAAGVVQPLGQERGEVGVEQLLARAVLRRDHAAPHVARRAGVDLATRRR